jgi:transposase
VPAILQGRFWAPVDPSSILFVGQFEGLDSECEIAWRCADSLSLRYFLYLADGKMVPDHSTFTITRSGLPLKVHHAVFGSCSRSRTNTLWCGAKRIGAKASSQEGNAALRRLVRQNTGEHHQEMLRRLAQESGIETNVDVDKVWEA